MEESKISPSDVHVLVVDEERFERLVVGNLLRRSGYKVSVSPSGKDAISQLRAGTNNINLVLANLVMNEIDGLKLLKFVRSNPQFNAIPVILMSTVEDKDKMLECISAGAEEYLIKPISKKEVTCIWHHVWRRIQNVNQMTRQRMQYEAMSGGFSPWEDAASLTPLIGALESLRSANQASNQSLSINGQSTPTLLSSSESFLQNDIVHRILSQKYENSSDTYAPTVSTEALSVSPFPEFAQALFQPLDQIKKMAICMNSLSNIQTGGFSEENDRKMKMEEEMGAGDRFTGHGSDYSQKSISPVNSQQNYSNYGSRQNDQNNSQIPSMSRPNSTSRTQSTENNSLNNVRGGSQNFGNSANGTESTNNNTSNNVSESTWHDPSVDGVSHSLPSRSKEPRMENTENRNVLASEYFPMRMEQMPVRDVKEQTQQQTDPKTQMINPTLMNFNPDSSATGIRSNREVIGMDIHTPISNQQKEKFTMENSNFTASSHGSVPHNDPLGIQEKSLSENKGDEIHASTSSHKMNIVHQHSISKNHFGSKIRSKDSLSNQLIRQQQEHEKRKKEHLIHQKEMYHSLISNSNPPGSTSATGTQNVIENNAKIDEENMNSNNSMNVVSRDNVSSDTRKSLSTHNPPIELDSKNDNSIDHGNSMSSDVPQSLSSSLPVLKRQHSDDVMDEEKEWQEAKEQLRQQQRIVRQRNFESSPQRSLVPNQIENEPTSETHSISNQPLTNPTQNRDHPMLNHHQMGNPNVSHQAIVQDKWNQMNANLQAMNSDQIQKWKVEQQIKQQHMLQQQRRMHPMNSHQFFPPRMNQFHSNLQQFNHMQVSQEKINQQPVNFDQGNLPHVTQQHFSNQRLSSQSMGQQFYQQRANESHMNVQSFHPNLPSHIEPYGPENNPISQRQTYDFQVSIQDTTNRVPYPQQTNHQMLIQPRSIVQAFDQNQQDADHQAIVQQQKNSQQRADDHQMVLHQTNSQQFLEPRIQSERNPLHESQLNSNRVYGNEVSQRLTETPDFEASEPPMTRDIVLYSHQKEEQSQPQNNFDGPQLQTQRNFQELGIEDEESNEGRRNKFPSADHPLDENFHGQTNLNLEESAELNNLEHIDDIESLKNLEARETTDHFNLDQGYSTHPNNLSRIDQSVSRDSEGKTHGTTVQPTSYQQNQTQLQMVNNSHAGLSLRMNSQMKQGTSEYRSGRDANFEMKLNPGLPGQYFQDHDQNSEVYQKRAASDFIPKQPFEFFPQSTTPPQRHTFSEMKGLNLTNAMTGSKFAETTGNQLLPRSLHPGDFSNHDEFRPGNVNSQSQNPTSVPTLQNPSSSRQYPIREEPGNDQYGKRKHTRIDSSIHFKQEKCEEDYEKFLHLGKTSQPYPDAKGLSNSAFHLNSKPQTSLSAQKEIVQFDPNLSRSMLQSQSRDQDPNQSSDSSQHQSQPIYFNNHLQKIQNPQDVQPSSRENLQHDSSNSQFNERRNESNEHSKWNASYNQPQNINPDNYIREFSENRDERREFRNSGSAPVFQRVRTQGMVNNAVTPLQHSSNRDDPKQNSQGTACLRIEEIPNNSDVGHPSVPRFFLKRNDSPQNLGPMKGLNTHEDSNQEQDQSQSHDRGQEQYSGRNQSSFSEKYPSWSKVNSQNQVPSTNPSHVNLQSSSPSSTSQRFSLDTKNKSRDVNETSASGHQSSEAAKLFPDVNQNKSERILVTSPFVIANDSNSNRSHSNSRSDSATFHTEHENENLYSGPKNPFTGQNLEHSQGNVPIIQFDLNHRIDETRDLFEKGRNIHNNRKNSKDDDTINILENSNTRLTSEDQATNFMLELLDKSMHEDQLNLNFPFEKQKGDVSLRTWLREAKDTSDVKVLFIFKQIVDLVQAYHSIRKEFRHVFPSFFTISLSLQVKVLVETREMYESKNLSVATSKSTEMDKDKSGREADKTSELEKHWYLSPEEVAGKPSSLASDVYRLGVLFFELFCPFSNDSEHSRVMFDMRHRILPPKILTDKPKECAFCLWLLHPVPDSRPTIQDILSSELLSEYGEGMIDKSTIQEFEEERCNIEILKEFLLKMQESKREDAKKVMEDLKRLSFDISEVERRRNVLLSRAVDKSFSQNFPFSSNPIQFNSPYMGRGSDNGEERTRERNEEDEDEDSDDSWKRRRASRSRFLGKRKNSSQNEGGTGSGMVEGREESQRKRGKYHVFEEGRNDSESVKNMRIGERNSNPIFSSRMFGSDSSRMSSRNYCKVFSKSARVLKNFNQLETVYFSMRWRLDSNSHQRERPNPHNPNECSNENMSSGCPGTDKDNMSYIPRFHTEGGSSSFPPFSNPSRSLEVGSKDRISGKDYDTSPNMNSSDYRNSLMQDPSQKLMSESCEKDPLGCFFDSLCKYARYSRFEVKATLRYGDLLNNSNMVCSLGFDRDDEFFATAGVCKKIKIFECDSVLSNRVDIHYPVVEMNCKSKLSAVCWNSYIKNHLASADYEGMVQLWDASTNQTLLEYDEHEKRAWSVDFSKADPTKLASGSDDGTVKLWSINQESSIATIKTKANVCCVQFPINSSPLLAFGSADYKVYVYDLRKTKFPLSILNGHSKAVSYVKFVDNTTLVSASTDNTLKLWDISGLLTSSPFSTSSTHSSPLLTLTGHSNEKNFVGLSVSNGYIACGSETNAVFTYHKSLPMPVASHRFGNADPLTGHETEDDVGQFVSSVCWRGSTQTLVAANSMGHIKILEMV